MTTIRVENVTKKFRGNTVIDQVSLTMTSGKVTGLKGINGSGKTMLMRLVCGLILPTEGKIVINDKELGKDMDFPESVGLLIENPAFLDSYSGFQNLKMLAGVRELISDEEIENVIRTVGLDPTDKKKFKKYSLGMKQRLGIAGAIMERPDIVLLDEPTNALDTKGIEMLKDVVAKEKERGALVILTCHDTGILQEMADDIYFMENGRIVDA